MKIRFGVLDTYLAVQERYVLDVCVLDVVENTGVLADTSHADTVGVVAP